MEKYNQSFLDALQTLNPEQRDAVEHIEGPVLVIAGPGTGKTQILAARIGKILMDTDTDAHNILCLTYTDAGAVAMRKRLFDFIGPDAYRVNIYTFHAFCNDVIQDNLDHFEKNSLDPISDLERIQLLRKLIDNFKPDHLLKRFRGDVYYESGRLQKLFSVMKQEGWSAKDIHNAIDEYLELLPEKEGFGYKNNRGDKKAGDLTNKGIEEKERMENLRVAAAEFDNFQRLMREASRYDFDDMIIWVLKAFKDDPNLLLSYQERYQYVLVDEYQDTSNSQNELISLLISFWDVPNVFVVGDDDQSIFRFQGANVQNIKAFEQRYVKDLHQVVLSKNYRSTQPILDAAKKLISLNQTRLISDKDLIAAHPTKQSIHISPVINEYDTIRQEMASVCNQVETLITDGIPAHEIAVIYKEHRVGEELARYFRLKEIPVTARRKLNLLEEPFTRNVLNILRYVASENDTPYNGDELLFEIMHYDFYKIQPIEIAKISVAVSQTPYKENMSIRRYIAELAAKNSGTLFENSAHKDITQLSRNIEYWIKEAYNLTLQGLFEKIITNGGILQYIMTSTDKIPLMQCLTALFDFIKEECRRNPSLTVRELMANIDLLRENDLRLELTQSFGVEKGVNFMTAHGSKGLEFEHVFLIGCTKNVWESKKGAGKNAYKLPETLFSMQTGASDLEELRRLFYVCITRAKTHLYLSFANEEATGKALEKSIFIAELQTENQMPIEKIVLQAEDLFAFEALQFTEQDQPQIELIDKDFVNRLLETFTLSVTALNNYLACPLKFYFQNLVRVPAGKSATMTFGSAVHYALQRLFEKMKASEKQEFPSTGELFDDFKWFMLRNRESFTREEFKRRMEYGEKILPPYYEYYLNSWNKIVSSERNIRNIPVNGVPINGKLDKLEFDGNSVNVVDYKTGNYENAKKKLKRPDEKEPLGGDYWRQAVFYKILVDNDRSTDWTVISSEFDFVEPDKKGNYLKEKIVITPEDIEIVTEQITHTWSAINTLQFDKGCGEEDCDWCNFVKTNYAGHLVAETEE